jgi:hypothetical protein
MTDDTQHAQNTRNERQSQQDHRVRHERREQKPSLPAGKSPESKEIGLDDEETEQDRKSTHVRSRHGGRPEKKVYEEWASDPYCE